MKRKIYCLVLLICLALTYVIGLIPVSAEESKTSYSDVLDDLREDENFKLDSFPAITDKSHEKYSSVEVFQIAEGKNKELFLYAYQPADSVLEIELTHVNMWDEYAANDKDSKAKAKLYELELVSTFEVFDKYLVKGYTVSDENERYYNLVSAYTPFNSSIHGDDDLVNGFTDYAGIKIAQQWCVHYFNDRLVYDSMLFNTMEIKVNYNGELLLNSGFKLGNLLLNSYDAYMLHFISFSCDDYVIKRIYDADLTFRLETKNESWVWSSDSLDPSVPTSSDTVTSDIQSITLYEKDTASYNGGGLFAPDYSWNRISTSSDFVENLEDQEMEFDSTARSEILKSQWTFAFTESEYIYRQTYYTSDYLNYMNYWTKTQSKAVNVGILRLHFIDDRGYEYNLGVVSDLTSSDGNIDGSGNLDVDFSSLEELIQIILLVLGIIVLLMFGSFLMPIISLIIKLVSFVIKLVVDIICLPFRLFGGSGRRKY